MVGYGPPAYWLVAVGTIGAFGTGGVLLMRELHRDRERDELMQRLQAGCCVADSFRDHDRPHIDHCGETCPKQRQ